MISLRKRGAIKTLAILMAVSLSQLYVQIGMAQGPRLISGRLTTTAGRAITVNGVPMATGGTIMTGMTLQTPDQVGATIDLGPLGIVEMDPNSTIEITFADDGTIRVKLLNGCVRVKKSGQGVGEIYTAEGGSEKDNNRNAMGFCFLNGGLNPIQQALTTAPAAGGTSNAVWWPWLVGGAAIGGLAWWGLRGENTSP